MESNFKYFGLTLSEAVDLIKNGKDKAPVSYNALLQVVKENWKSIIAGLESKIKRNEIDIAEMTESSNVNKFELQRLELEKAEIVRQVEAQYTCAGSDVSSKVMSMLAANDGCGAVNAIVQAASLNTATLEDSPEYKKVVKKIEKLTEGPNSATIKEKKEANEAYQESIKRINDAVSSFLKVPGAPDVAA